MPLTTGAAQGAAGPRQLPGWRDLVATLLVLATLITLGAGVRQLAAPVTFAQPATIVLSPAVLPAYVLHTVTRMLLALLASLVFTFTYATLAAKSRRAEMVLIPLLDVLQSVPVLGYLSFTVMFFIALFPHSTLGAELAAIFAIFTSQAWNMAFSFYQSLRTVPTDLDEASRSFRATGWQRFWRLEVPFAMPGLLWNTMMSMSGGWFFVVASEAISVGSTQIALPGVGSYVALAIERRDLAAVGWAIAAMTVTILLYDQLLFRPLVSWADKFRYEESGALQRTPHSWVLDLLRGSRWLTLLLRPLGGALQSAARAPLALPRALGRALHWSPPHHLGELLWAIVLVAGAAWLLRELVRFAGAALSWGDLTDVAGEGALTLLRVAVLVLLASLVWVPIGVAVGLRPRLAQAVQPLAQFLAAFPANLLFPLAVFVIVRFDLGPKLWLSPLMILGTQWYVLFNVIAGAIAYPGDLREVAQSFRVRRLNWWRQVMLPGVFPYFVTGAITASGGAWNASIVSETVRWGTTRLDGGGLGAYIARKTDAGDLAHVALGIALMSVMVIAMNRLLWRPLYAFAERRTRLD